MTSLLFSNTIFLWILTIKIRTKTILSTDCPLAQGFVSYIASYNLIRSIRRPLQRQNLNWEEIVHGNDHKEREKEIRKVQA
jgi:hypothetical protein